MVIINFINKQEKIIMIIIIIIEKKIAITSLSGEKHRGKVLVGKKRVGKKFRLGKILSLANNLVTFPQHFSPR